MKTWALAVAVAMGVAGVANAAVPRPPRAKVREAHQRERIRDNIRDRSLTPAETARLRQEQLRIHEMAKDFASDGVVTPAERAKLEAAQDAASRHIAIQSNDLQGAGGPGISPERRAALRRSSRRSPRRFSISWQKRGHSAFP